MRSRQRFTLRAARRRLGGVRLAVLVLLLAVAAGALTRAAADRWVEEDFFQDATVGGRIVVEQPQLLTVDESRAASQGRANRLRQRADARRAIEAAPREFSIPAILDEADAELPARPDDVQGELTLEALGEQQCGAGATPSSSSGLRRF